MNFKKGGIFFVIIIILIIGFVLGSYVSKPCDITKPKTCILPDIQECEEETGPKEISAKESQIVTAIFFSGRVAEKTSDTLTVEGFSLDTKDEKLSFIVNEGTAIHEFKLQPEEVSDEAVDLEIEKIPMSFEDIKVGDLISGRVNTQADTFDAAFLIITQL